jgi:hypothetical protein
MKLRRNNHNNSKHKAIPALLILLVALFAAPLVPAAPGQVTVEGVDFKPEVRVNDATSRCADGGCCVA